MNSSRIDFLLDQLKKDGEDPFLLYGLAMEYMTSDTLKALEYLQLTVGKYPDYLPVYFQLGTLLKEFDNIDQCKNVLKQGIKVAGDQNNQKTLNELRSFLTNIEFEY